MKNNELNFNYLQEAITQTFKQRGTTFVKNPKLFTESFPNDTKRQIMWKAFLRKANISEDLEFTHIVKSIIERLQPIYYELLRNETENILR